MARAKPARPRRLKTFRAHIGFYDYLIAAPSKKAALAALDVRQDLFREKLMAETTDAGDMATASRQPGVPLRRPAGTKQPFVENSDALPKVPRAPASTAKAQRLAFAARRKKDAARASLDALDKAQQKKVAHLQREQERLDRARIAAERGFERKRRALATHR